MAVKTWPRRGQDLQYVAAAGGGLASIAWSSEFLGKNRGESDQLSQRRKRAVQQQG